MEGTGIRIHWPGRGSARPPSPRGRLAPLERFAGAGGEREGPTLILGDNLAAMEAMLATNAGQVDLAYLDPPFGTGRRFRTAGKVTAYDDRHPGGLSGLLSLLEPRLRAVHALLAPTGSLYVHLDANAVHPVKLLLDEIFGPACFQRQIVWRIGWVSGFKAAARNWARNHDTILFYTKDPRRFTFQKPYVPHPPGYRRRGGGSGPGRGVAVDDVWNAGPADLALKGRASLTSIQIKSLSREKTGFATQKNESLLERIVSASSGPGDRVLDPFCGSGTTLVVADRLGRRAVGIDREGAAADVCRRRVVGVCGRPLSVAVVSGEEGGPWRCAGPVEVRARRQGDGLILRLCAARHGERTVSPASITGWAVAAGRGDDGAPVFRFHAFRSLPEGPMDTHLGPIPWPTEGPLRLWVRAWGPDGTTYESRIRFGLRGGRLVRRADPDDP